jgi:hypothetical protein
MNKFLQFLLIFVVSLCFFLFIMSVGHSECLPTAKAVWEAHPGSHATWRIRNGEKCWYARAQRREAKATIPLPRERQVMPVDQPKTPEAVDTRPPEDNPSTGAALIAQEHAQFRTVSTELATLPYLDALAWTFLQERMVSVGWRLWLQASVERARIAQVQLQRSRSLLSAATLSAGPDTTDRGL